MKTLHGKTANEIILDLIDDGIEMTPEMGKVVSIIVDTYGCLPYHIEENYNY